MLVKRHMWKVAVVAVVLVGVAVLALALVNDVSEAAGPGGRGRGAGGNGGGYGGAGGGYGAAQGYDQRQMQQYYADGTGMQNGNSWGGANAQLGGGILLDLPPAAPGELPADVVAALTAGITDEYHAYAIYQAVIDQFGAVRPFTNIQRAELSHSDALAFLFERYGLDVPQPDALDVVPQFASVQEACAAAAAAEIANFDLYDTWIATVQDYPDIVHVFTALRDASEFQHLPAFEVCAG